MNDLAERQQLLRDIRRVSRDLKTSIPETLPALQIILAQVQAARAVQDTILPSMDRFSSHADEILQLLEDIKLMVSMDPAPEPRNMRTSTEVTAVLACQGAAYVDLHPLSNTDRSITPAPNGAAVPSPSESESLSSTSRSSKIESLLAGLGSGLGLGLGLGTLGAGPPWFSE
jgi:hypothetical protein